MALVTRAHRERIERLSHDPHIRAMAAELPEGFDRFADWDFVSGALREYERRSGTSPHTIGAAAEAVELAYERGESLADEHMRLVHPDGSECPDGCDAPPMRGREG